MLKNLPITSCHSQLVQNLRAALGSNAATAGNEPGQTGDRHVIKPHSGRHRVQRTRTGKNCCVAAEPNVPKHPQQVASDEEGDEFSDAGSSMDDILSPPAVPTDSADQLFTPAQLSAIQDTVLSSISVALADLPRSGNPPLDLTSSSTRSHHLSNVATPLGFNCPLDKTLKDKIFFALLLPDILYQPRYSVPTRGLVPRLPEFLVEFHSEEKASCRHFLNTFTSYMLVIMAVYPRHSLELIKYMQSSHQVQGTGLVVL